MTSTQRAARVASKYALKISANVHYVLQGDRTACGRSIDGMHSVDRSSEYLYRGTCMACLTRGGAALDRIVTAAHSEALAEDVARRVSARSVDGTRREKLATVPMAAEDVAHRIGTVILEDDGRMRTVRSAGFGSDTVRLIYTTGPCDSFRRSYILQILPGYGQCDGCESLTPQPVRTLSGEWGTATVCAHHHYHV